MDPTRDDGQMDCTEPPADALEPEIAAMDVCVAAERPKETELSTDEERSLTGVSEQTPVQSQDKNERYNRNFKKFLENGKTSLEIRSHRERNVSERLIKSDGVVETKVDYQGNVSKISSILSEVRLERSSAPPTYETASRQNPETKEIEVASRPSTTKESVGIPPGNLQTPIFSGTMRTPGPANAPSSSKTPSTDFKTPVPPPNSPVPPSSTLFSSPGTSKIRGGQSTPSFRRPTDFAVAPRKSYYMFSPEDSGILRQCRSMPEINRRQRKEEKHQRRSLILEDRSRIVRSLFRDPPGLVTPETRRSMVPKSHIPGPSKEAAAKEGKGRSSLGSVKSNICRKLTFAPIETPCAAPIEERNMDDGKRKETSPPFAECPPTSVKKVRILPQPEKKEDVDTGSDITGQESNVPSEISDVPRETEESPAKRKSGESSIPKKK